MAKELKPGKMYALNRNVYAYRSIGRDNNLTGSPVRTSTDNAGNHARITKILQFGHTRRGNINKKRALVELSDIANHTLFAWIDASQADEIGQMKKNPRRRAKRNPVSAALAVLKAAEAAHYMKKNPKPRARMSGRKVRIGKRGMEFAGYGRARLRTVRDPRRVKKYLRKAGFRVNPKLLHRKRFYIRVIGRKVIFSREAVQDFKRVFPASGLRDRAYWFEFDSRGDLVDTDVPQHDDGPGASALSDDAKAYLFDGKQEKWMRNPRGKTKRGKRMSAQDLRRKVTGVIKKARQQFTRNPVTKQIRLQEKRGAGWITLALFPLAQKAFAVKMAKLCHRKHPGKTLRLVS